MAEVVTILRVLDDCAGYIRERTEFKARTRKTPYGDFVSMSGYSKVAGQQILTYHLPKAYAPGVTAASYVVYSYDTPIAYWIPTPKDLSPEAVAAWLLGAELGQWVIPDICYTTTTSGHQSEVRSALSGHGGFRNNWRRLPEIPYEHGRAEGAPERVLNVGCERHGY